MKSTLSVLAVAVLCLTSIQGDPAPVSIMQLGDSITQGGGIGNAPDQAGYRDRLFTDLKAAHVAFTFIGVRSDNASPQLISAGDQFHNGFSGHTLVSIAGNLAGVAFASPRSTDPLGGYWLTGGGAAGRPAANPGIVTLLAGTNDLLFGNTLDQMESSMDGILAWFHANRPNAVVIVGTVLPYQTNQFVPDSPAIAQAKDVQGTAFNAWLKSEEMPKYSNYRLVDISRLFRKPGGAINETLLSTDRLHPNAAGYQVIGDAWAPAVRAALAAN
jgi:lysophospholipase L1-like esterase